MKNLSCKMCRSTDRGAVQYRRSTGVPIRHRQPETDAFAGDHMECTGSSCHSCTAVLVADCIAIGCCPCAVVNVLALTLVKLPWRASRKCLKLLQRGRGRSLHRRIRDDGRGTMQKLGKMAMVTKGSESIMAATAADEEDCNIRSSNGRRSSLCSRTEAEKLWMELYQRGHWGFGRVSFSGNLEGHLAGKRPSVSSPNAPAAIVAGNELMS